MATYISRSPEATRELGEHWGRTAPEGWVIGLCGDLGAGKTQLVTGLARGLGVTERVLSPSFTLVHEYRTGRLPLFHLDLYRLDNPGQVIGAGLEEYLSRPCGVAVVEWADRWFESGGAGLRPGQGLPRRYRSVRIAIIDEFSRSINYEDIGD